MSELLVLQHFDPPVLDDSATVALIANKLHYCEENELHDELQPFSKYVNEYPAVEITLDMLVSREPTCTIDTEDLFCSVSDNIYKKITSIWREKGIVEAIRFTAATDPGRITKFVHWIAIRLQWTLDLIDKQLYQREVLPVSGSGSVADVVSTRNWNGSVIRCFAWHPHCERIAVATKDDRIRVFSKAALTIPVLRHSNQKSICCLSWKPHAGTELAVACQTGILIWTVDMGPWYITKNSRDETVFLRHRNHAPVTNVQWHPQGDLLVSCSPTDSNMIIWDVSRKEGVPLKHIRGGGICLIRWSLCGMQLFSASTSKFFRIWNTAMATPWQSDVWQLPTGRIAAACFGPNLTLLFASTENPVTVCSLPLQETVFNVKAAQPITKTRGAVPLIDFSEMAFMTYEGERILVGGRITAMDWDSSGRYLAVLFRDSPLVALIKTKISKYSKAIQAEPSCFIKGFPNEVPCCINFYAKHNSTHPVICLTIAWSSARVQHFPIVDNECNNTSNYIKPQM